ncbi:MAG: TRAP transporter small permease subunit [Pseudomonadota bacterium]
MGGGPDPMGLLQTVLRPVETFNIYVLWVARWFATGLLALMVLIIFYQIIMRAIDPVGWTTPAAKFLMLWMIGVAAPIAYRHGGFVGIDLLERSLPRRISQFLTLMILLMSSLVMIYGIQLGHDAVNSFTGKGTIPGFKIELTWAGLKDFKIRNWHAFASLYGAFCLLFIVNIELILRHLVRIMGGGAQLIPLEG